MTVARLNVGLCRALRSERDVHNKSAVEWRGVRHVLVEGLDRVDK